LVVKLNTILNQNYFCGSILMILISIIFKAGNSLKKRKWTQLVCDLNHNMIDRKLDFCLAIFVRMIVCVLIF